MEITVTQAQSDMRRGYYSGAAGILASALAWSVSAGTAAMVSPEKAIWVLLVIGGRYLVFGTLFGLRLYWALGLALAGAGFVLAWLGAAAVVIVATGAAIEWVFGWACVAAHRRWMRWDVAAP